MAKTVWIYLNEHDGERRHIGDEDWVKVFASREAADRWLAKNEPEGVAWEYPVEKDHPAPRRPRRKQ